MSVEPEKYGKRFLVNKAMRDDAAMDVDAYLISRAVPTGYRPIDGTGEIRWLDPSDPDVLPVPTKWDKPIIDAGGMYAVVTVDCVPDEGA